jgi:hypothetical protein
MTMQHLPHPDDERLAAYAGGDSDALADPSLVAHLSACDRCRPLLDELSLLRGALAELPDIAPSRPLRLVPPVAAPPSPAARGSWLRRLTAPAMAVGAGLVLVGAVGIGTPGAVGDLFGRAASGPAPQEAASASDREGVPVAGADSPSLEPGDTAYGSVDSFRSNEPRSLSSAQPPSPRPSADDAGRTEDVTNEVSSEQPWLTLLIAGVGLFGISAALRFSLSPRAG